MDARAWLARHEATAKKRSLRIYELYRRARDKNAAARLLDDFAAGRITYEELIRGLEELARH
ncbi:MAG: hypothetical protein GSR80_001022 [Desulfurococcales archaeon]|nr:hypothetical protein [Desulfurococcales archaeon]